MFAFLKSESFKIIGSAVLGIGIIAALKPICHGPSCIIQKAPPPNEITQSTYQLASKCYQFKTTQIQCPERGVIEPFYVI
jgi:hypothetical protein